MRRQEDQAPEALPGQAVRHVNQDSSQGLVPKAEGAGKVTVFLGAPNRDGWRDQGVTHPGGKSGRQSFGAESVGASGQVRPVLFGRTQWNNGRVVARSEGGLHLRPG